MWIGHRKEIRKPTFWALARRRSESIIDKTNHRWTNKEVNKFKKKQKEESRKDSQ